MKTHRVIGVTGNYIHLKPLGKGIKRKKLRNIAMRSYKRLNQKQKEAVNIMAMEQMRLLPVNERHTYSELINATLKKDLTERYSEEIIEKKQMRRLRSAIKETLKKIKNETNAITEDHSTIDTK